MNTIQIRPFQESDTPILITIFREAVHTINRKHYSPEQIIAWVPHDIDRKKWHDAFLQNITLIAEIDGIIVGFVEMSKTGYLDKLYVHKNYQGQFIALHLFKEVERVARELGFTKITTHCSITAKIPAERVGFSVIKEQTVTRNGISMTNYVMEKKL